MIRISVLKRSCLVFVMLFGLCFGLNNEVSKAASYAITGDGCHILKAGPGGFNGGPPQSYEYTGAVGCTSPTLSNVEMDDIVIVNATSPLVVNNPPTTNYVGTITGTYTVVGISPLLTGNFTTILTPSYCKDFFGQTNDNPVVNQGVIDFDNEAPNGDLRPCFELSSDAFPAGEIHYDLDGWAWNTNLGWVAMKAEDLGSGEENRGVPIGSQEFNSELRVGTSYTGDGEFFGYWWNDAAGWIKLNCASDITLNASDPDQCATANYQVYIDSFDATTNRAVLAGFAWSDSVGYIDFTGVEISVPGLTPTYDAKVTYEKVNSGKVYSNGVNGYRIKVSFFDGATNVTEEFADSRLRNAFCLEYQDNRVIDTLSDPVAVVRSGLRPSEAPLYTCGNFANDRPNVDNLFMNNLGWDTISNGGLLGFGSNRFSYDNVAKEFVLNAGSEVESLIPISSEEELTLTGVKMFNDITRLTKLDSSPEINGAMLFEPPHDLIITGSQDTTSASCKDVAIELEFESPVKASMCGDYFRGNLGSELRASIVGEPKVNTLYQDRFDAISAVLSDTGAIFENVPVSQNGFGSRNIDITLDLADGVSANELNPIKALLNLEVVSSVEYTVGATTVRREGPKIQNESQNIFELNIQGGLADRSFGSSAFSSGAKDTQAVNQGLEVKERVYRVLRNVLQMENKPGKCGEIPFEKLGIKFSSENSFVRDGVNELMLNCGRISQSGGRNVVFVGGVESSGNFVAYSELKGLIEKQFLNGKAPVVVLYGVDLIIDEDILPGAVLSRIAGKVDVTDLGPGVDEVPGFVVIESENKEYGGDIIVSANVTDVVGYFYADGRMMAAPSLGLAVNAATGDADIVLNRALLDEQPLFNQFSLLGALYSTNCIGCASNVPPLRADGSVAETRKLSLIEDLNAFRYTPLNFNIGSYNVEVPELDAFGFPVVDGNGDPVMTIENYTCLVPCNVSSSSFNPLDNSGQSKNECRNVESKIAPENACFDYDIYASGQNELSLLEESIADLSRQGQQNTGVSQYDVVVEQGLDESTVRSVNIRSLEIPDGMPVFGVISR